nr:hypothetical protein [Microvirga brassicacearum]
MLQLRYQCTGSRAIQARPQPDAWRERCFRQLRIGQKIAFSCGECRSDSFPKIPASRRSLESGSGIFNLAFACQRGVAGFLGRKADRIAIRRLRPVIEQNLCRLFDVRDFLALAGLDQHSDGSGKPQVGHAAKDIRPKRTESYAFGVGSLVKLIVAAILSGRSPPLRCCTAAAPAFPDGSIKIASLRREAARGRFQI